MAKRQILVEAPLEAIQVRRLYIGAGAWMLFWAAMAIAPLDRGAWVLENLLVFVGFGVLALTWRRVRLSEASYWLILIYAAMHVVGSHYTYADTPIGFWLQELLGMSRNHYDRVVHFSFGLLLTRPFFELFTHRAKTDGIWTYVFVLSLVAAASTVYELIEWIIASMASPHAALAWLGTQGDEFDAQKDTGLAILGSLIALSVEALLRRRRV